MKTGIMTWSLRRKPRILAISAKHNVFSIDMAVFKCLENSLHLRCRENEFSVLEEKSLKV